jgi:glycosyltransferase involved in cell wall biosynthesis
MMDVLVLPSLFEGIPRSLMEGAAMGVPLVATYVKGNREVVKHRQNGLLVPLNNTAALSDAILDLLNNRTAAQQMSTQGRRMALQHFDERRVFHMIQQEYARLLRARNLPVPQPAAYAPATR